MSKLNFIDLFAGASGNVRRFYKSRSKPNCSRKEMNEEACFSIKQELHFTILPKIKDKKFTTTTYKVKKSLRTDFIQTSSFRNFRFSFEC